MQLCTLHPSLSALTLNLELNESMVCALFDRALLQKLGNLDPIPGYFEYKKRDNHIQNKSDLDLSAIASIEAVLQKMTSDCICLCSDSFLQIDKPKSMLLERIQALGVKTRTYNPKSLAEILDLWQDLGKEFGKESRARDLRQRVEAQLMDWTSNFYSRLRGKRVLVISGFSPLIAASSWINDLLRRIGAVAPELDSEADQVVVNWEFVASFDPQVIVFAPVGSSLSDSCKLFFKLESQEWDGAELFHSTSAAKRGDIFFCSGQSDFYSQDYRIIDSIGALVSATAGFDSGYITDRDSFYKIRFLELHRHKFPQK